MAQNRSLQSVLNQCLKQMASPFNTYASCMNGIVTAAPGDPMWGVQIEGTTYNWNDLTQMMINAFYWFQINNNLPAGVEKGEPAEATLQQVLDTVKSQYPANVYWNGSYTWWQSQVPFPLHP